MTDAVTRTDPILLRCENGKPIASLVGAVPHARVETLLDAHLAPRAA